VFLFFHYTVTDDIVVSYAVEPGDSGLSVGCVLRLSPAEPINRDDVQVTRVEQLDSSLTLDFNEELLSNIIRINAQQVCSIGQQFTDQFPPSRRITGNDGGCQQIAVAATTTI